MPTSYPRQLSKIVETIMIVNPNNMLDIGVGFGKYGFLAREYLELWNGNNEYKKWSRRIDGIEVFKGYITPVHDFIYNNIYIGNAKEVIPSLEVKYDLILMIDVLEHFTKEEGLELLKKCKEASKTILISTPKDIYEQGSSFDNPYEKHEFQWLPKHLNKFETVVIPDELSHIILISDNASEIEKKIKLERRKNFITGLKTYIKVRFPFLLKIYRKRSRL